MAYGPPKYGIQTPLFIPYEPFLLGVGVVFNLLRFTQPGFGRIPKGIFPGEMSTAQSSLKSLESRLEIGLASQRTPEAEFPKTAAETAGGTAGENRSAGGSAAG